MKVAPTSRASDPSIEELLEFERLLFELSVRFANVSADQVVAAIETALLGLVRFLDFDRGAFWEFVDDRQQNFRSSRHRPLRSACLTRTCATPQRIRRSR